MRRFMIAGLVAGLVLSTFVVPGVAKKKRKPVATSLYLHGTEQFGEMETVPNQVGGLQGNSPDYMAMDPVEPTGSEKSMMITTYGAGPNVTCAGNTLFPVWSGDVKGTIKGDVKVTLFTTSMPAQIDIRLWPDIIDTTCNADYPAPARELRVDVPAGEGKIEAVLPGDPFTAAGKLLLQVSPASIADPTGAQRPLPPFVGRVFYDSPATNSGVSFSCLPPKGAKTCTPAPAP